MALQDGAISTQPAAILMHRPVAHDGDLAGNNGIERPRQTLAGGCAQEGFRPRGFK
jgi:hypothetical protein